MNKFETKKIIYNQRQNWRLFLNKNDLQINDELLIFYPETSIILQNIELKNLKREREREVKKIFIEKYQDGFNDDE